MTARSPHLLSPGPFTADQIAEGEPYELSNGHLIRCESGGGRHANENAIGTLVLASDPAAKEVGVDAGFSWGPRMLRAPDVAVGNVPNEPGWVKGVPHLAVEYAEVGQDEVELRTEIQELLEAGTRFLWVVRLTGLRRVEVYEPGKAVRTVLSGELLTAPGVLKNPVPVDALYDRDAADRVTLTNLLQRQGFEDLEAVLAKGRTEGVAKGVAHAVLAVLEARGIELTAEVRARITASTDPTELDRWVRRAAVVGSEQELFEPRG